MALAGRPPLWMRGAGAEAGAAAAAATIGPWLVLILLGCGVAEFAVRDHPRAATTQAITAFPLLAGGPSGPLARPARSAPPQAPGCSRWRGPRSRSARCRSAAGSSSSR
jgi:hypothetical protein